MAENRDLDPDDLCPATIDLGARGLHMCMLHRGHTGSHRHNELMAVMAEQQALLPKAFDGQRHAAAILNDLAPGTAEQIATRIIECFEAGQRRSDGSMALHPNRERWYIADAYRLAKMVLGETARRGWVCIRHRCAEHYDVPAQNTNEASGSECGGCIAAERDALKHKLDWLAKHFGGTW